jgi:hypothetical protein
MKEVELDVGLTIKFLNGLSSIWEFFLFHLEKMAFFIAQVTITCMSRHQK